MYRLDIAANLQDQRKLKMCQPNWLFLGVGEA